MSTDNLISEETNKRVQRLAKESADYAQDVNGENWHVHYYGFIYGYQKAQSQYSFLTTNMPDFSEMAAIRRSKDLSLRDVAKKTGVSAPTISRLEQGKEVEHGNWVKLYEYYQHM